MEEEENVNVEGDAVSVVEPAQVPKEELAVKPEVGNLTTTILNSLDALQGQLTGILTRIDGLTLTGPSESAPETYDNVKTIDELDLS